MNSFHVRKLFFDFFVKHGHTVVPSSSLIPAGDPTLLFANAGMNQFKDVFLGKEKRSYNRATSIQKCIRAGGKHNDLENVGFTKRHLTFFEMMGNFSFGDYFKKEAIRFAWDFLTTEVKLPIDKLYVSVYKLDDESYEIWNKEIGVPHERISRLGEADNFWQMGDTGPCGPCTEIYIDRGTAFGCKEKCGPGCSCDRFLEIWNLVFMQFDRQSSGTDVPLKATGVDTGMGLERLIAVLQNTESIYETDIFEPLIKHIEELTGITYNTADDKTKAAFRVLCDHVRSSCFAIADGATPSNEGRGYVIRKIIRRAALFAQKLRADKNIFPEIAPTLIEHMSGIYPELKTNQKLIMTLLESEVQKFQQNLVNGQSILNDYFDQEKAQKIITGAQAFKLYDTYGFPLELTKVIAQEHGYSVDVDGFEILMEKQRVQSGKKMKQSDECPLDESIFTHFTGYDEHITKSRIIALLVDGTIVDTVTSGTVCDIITEHSPFYVECGGQISDQGTVHIGGKETKLLGLSKVNKAIAAVIEAPVDIAVGDAVELRVDSPSRINTMKNHTATHLLQAALIEVLGKQVKQSGSVVEPDYLRFDFAYHESPTAEQIRLVEDLVNKKIFENIPLKIEQTTLKDAQSRGVIAFFGEKYNPEHVRVVQVPGFSQELCGGTHVRATGDIGAFKITEISSLSAGNRRIVALTGPGALQLFQQTFDTVKALSQEFKTPLDQVQEAVKKQKEQLKVAQQEIKTLKKQMFKEQIPALIHQATLVNGLPVLFTFIPSADIQDLKDIATDLLKAKLGLYFLISQDSQRSQFFATLSSEHASKVSIKDLAVWLKEHGMQGGAKDTSIQGGGPVVTEALKEKFLAWVTSNIK